MYGFCLPVQRTEARDARKEVPSKLESEQQRPAYFVFLASTATDSSIMPLQNSSAVSWFRDKVTKR